jgi:hypothetical protein
VSGGVTVRGAATPEEVAAVLALLAAGTRPEPEPEGYRRWREVRRAACRRHARMDA